MNPKLAALFVIAGLTTAAFGQTASTAPMEVSSTEPSTEPTTQTAMEDSGPATNPTTQMAGASTQPSTYGNNRTTRYTPTQQGYGTQGYGRNRRFNNQQSPAVSSPLAAATPQPRRMSADFEILTTRSIFIRGSQNTFVDSGPVQPRIFIRDSQPAYQPERSMVFNGVTKSDTATAMVENIDTHDVTKVHVGESLLSGKVVGITLNTLDYEVDGRVRRIQIGQNLAGGIVQSLAQALTPSGAPASQPSNANMPMTRQLGETIEMYLRRRHAAGL